uniref:Small ribosomal subunit protein uS8c n=1 Tax=Interfilum terricola TaxID=163310 RepID=A0A097KPN3_9VIRI|nr:ribosomal protein S8 [Interfilum terricola]AIT95137.1 ribosomal protein S8 [Interfilum terricola]
MVNDTISDMLTRIRNANLVKSQNVFLPITRISQQLCQILEKEGFINSYQVTSSGITIRLKYIGREKKPCITNLRRISKPGLRVYTNYKEIPLILNGMGIVILSTPSGLMTDRDARNKKLGGEILCSLW